MCAHTCASNWVAIAKNILASFQRCQNWLGRVSARHSVRWGRSVVFVVVGTYSGSPVGPGDIGTEEEDDEAEDIYV